MMNTAGMDIGMWILWIVVIIILVFAVKLMMDNLTIVSGTTSDGPMEILKKRYARGEIDKDEFERMKQELEK